MEGEEGGCVAKRCILRQSFFFGWTNRRLWRRGQPRRFSVVEREFNLGAEGAGRIKLVSKPRQRMQVGSALRITLVLEIGHQPIWSSRLNLPSLAQQRLFFPYSTRRDIITCQ